MKFTLQLVTLVLAGLVLTGGNARFAKPLCNDAQHFGYLDQIVAKYGQPTGYILGEEGRFWTYGGNDGSCLIDAYFHGPIVRVEWHPKTTFVPSN